MDSVLVLLQHTCHIVRHLPSKMRDLEMVPQLAVHRKRCMRRVPTGHFTQKGNIASPWKVNLLVEEREDSGARLLEERQARGVVFEVNARDSDALPFVLLLLQAKHGVVKETL